MKIALLGTGHLLESMLAGALRAQVPADWFACSVRRDERVVEIAQRHGVQATTSNADAAADAHLVLVGVSPDSLEQVLAEISPALRPGAVVAVATVPTTMAELRPQLPEHVAVARIIPSVNACVGEGICFVTLEDATSPEQAELLATFLAATGEVHDVAEERLGILGSLAGSGPAYLAAMIQAMAQGAASAGIEAAEALRLAVATARGTAAMLETGLTPDELAAAVGHPGGSTARALTHLAESGALSAMTAAVTHSYEDSAD